MRTGCEFGASMISEQWKVADCAAALNTLSEWMPEVLEIGLWIETAVALNYRR